MPDRQQKEHSDCAMVGAETYGCNRLGTAWVNHEKSLNGSVLCGRCKWGHEHDLRVQRLCFTWTSRMLQRRRRNFFWDYHHEGCPRKMGRTQKKFIFAARSVEVGIIDDGKKDKTLTSRSFSSTWTSEVKLSRWCLFWEKRGMSRSLALRSPTMKNPGLWPTSFRPNKNRDDV